MLTLHPVSSNASTPVVSGQGLRGAAATSPRDDEVRRIVEQLCKRQYWFIQRDRALKDLGRLDSHLDKTQSASCDFPSANAVLLAEKKRVERARDKSSARVNEVDSQLTKEVGLFLETYAAARASGEPASVDMEGSVAKATESAVKSQMAQEMRRLEARLHTRCDERYETLKRELEEIRESKTRLEAQQGERLREAKEVKTVLETKLDELARGLNAAAEANSKTAQDLARWVGEVERHAEEVRKLASPSSRSVEAISERLARTEATARKVETDLAASAQRTADLPSGVSQMPTADLDSVKSPISAIRDQVQQETQAVSSREAAPGPLALIQAQITADVKTRLGRLTAGFGALIDKERRHIGDLEGAAQRTDGRVDAIRALVEEVTAKQVNLATHVNGQLSRHMGDLNAQRQEAKWARDHLDALQKTVARGTDEIRFQIGCLSSWQNNFSTATLYRDIAQHLSATLPEEVGQRVKALSCRLDMLESRMSSEDAGSPKRRKVSSR